MWAVAKNTSIAQGTRQLTAFETGVRWLGQDINNSTLLVTWLTAGGRAFAFGTESSLLRDFLFVIDCYLCTYAKSI